MCHRAHLRARAALGLALLGRAGRARPGPSWLARVLCCETCMQIVHVDRRAERESSRPDKTKVSRRVALGERDMRMWDVPRGEGFIFKNIVSFCLHPIFNLDLTFNLSLEQFNKYTISFLLISLISKGVYGVTRPICQNATLFILYIPEDMARSASPSKRGSIQC